MQLDYSQGCVNFRDVGEFVNIIAQEKRMAEKRIFRGGKLDYVMSLEEIGDPKTIINLQRGEDKVFPSVVKYHFPISNDYEKYNTEDKEVRKWLNKIVKVFENQQLEYPVFVHCTSGKDRTGVVIAALLWILQIPENVIVEEYLLSDGDINKDWICSSIEGIKNDSNYFNRVNLQLIRNNIGVAQLEKEGGFM